MAARPRRTVGGKALSLASWNADGVWSRKLKLEHFFSQHGVNICLLRETFLNSGQAFRLGNSLPPHRQTNSRVWHGHSGPAWYYSPLGTGAGPAQLEATAIQIMLAGRPVKVLAAYLSPSRPLIGADLDSCFGGGLPVLMAGDLNAKHVNWNSRLNTRRGKLLRDYAFSLGRTTQPLTHTTTLLLPMSWTS